MILVIGTISLILKTLIVQSLFLFYDSRVRTFFWTFFIKITSVYLAKFIVDSCKNQKYSGNNRLEIYTYRTTSNILGLTLISAVFLIES